MFYTNPHKLLKRTVWTKQIEIDKGKVCFLLMSARACVERYRDVLFHPLRLDPVTGVLGVL